MVQNKDYSQDAKKYGCTGSSTMPDMNVRRLEIENLLKYINDGDDCLEAGCGNGYASVRISEQKEINLQSFDFTGEMIEQAKQQDISKIKGNIEFSHQDILNIEFTQKFDTVFSIRCIINLLEWKLQKTALSNLAMYVKDGGKLVLLEAFLDGLNELNEAREEFNQEPIKSQPFNLHFDKEKVTTHLSGIGFELEKEDNFLSSYYYHTRVLYPALSQALGLKLKFNSKFDSFFSHAEPQGNFSHIKILVFRKKIPSCPDCDLFHPRGRCQ